MFSVASRLLRRDRDSAGPPTPLLPLASLEEELGRLCTPPSPGNDPKPQPVSERVVVRIQIILRHVDDVAGRKGHAAWWPRPRTYAILRMINGLRFMDAFIQHSWNDFYLPVHEADLPEFVRDEPGHPFREQFLAVQDYYLSPTREIETASLEHFRMYDGDMIFKHIRRLGQGGFGSVDCVRSTLSFKDYARKRVFKGTAEHAKQAQRRLVSELRTMKGLRHQHLVQILGSYTDTQYIAYIMLPVASLTLGDFLGSKKKLGDSDKSMLRRFYGCLAGAINYLHQNRVRHNDITRRNVLIDKGEVYIADFGSCHSWGTQAPLGSRTRHITTSVSPDYMAPEIAAPDSVNAPKGRSADMWSLGVLFLEMTTRLLDRPLVDLQAALKKSAKEIAKPGFLYANPQFVPEWMEILRQSSHFSQHDNEPLQWIRVLLQKSPKLRFTSVTLMNRMLDSPSFAEFHCFKCREEFVNSQITYQSPAPRFDPEGDSRVMMDSVGGVFGGDEEVYEPRPSKKKNDFIERWRSGAPVSIIPEYEENDAQGEEFVDYDATSMGSIYESAQGDEGPPMMTDQLLYGLEGQSPVPQYPQDGPDAISHHRQANTSVQDTYNGSAYMWDWDHVGTEYSPEEAAESPLLKPTFSTAPSTSKIPDSTALFEEDESASSDEAEDDTRLFEEISDKSETGSDVSFSPGVNSNCLSDEEHDDEPSNRGELDTRNANPARVEAIESGHGIFEEEEEASASESEGTSHVSGIALEGEPSQDVAEAVHEEPSADPESSKTVVDTVKRQAENGGDQGEPDAHLRHEEPVEPLKLQSGDQKLIEARPPLPEVVIPQNGATSKQAKSSEGKTRKQPDEIRVEKETTELLPAPQPVEPLKPEPSICSPSSSTEQANPQPKPTQKAQKARSAKAKGKTTSSSANADPMTAPHPKAVPSILVHPPENETTGGRKKSAGQGKGGPDSAPGGGLPLSKENLEKIAPKKPKERENERDPVMLLNPASFLKSTGDKASSIATSTMSENTKKSIAGLGLPVKQADKMNDFLSLHCQRGKLAVVRWLLDEGCNPGTTKRRRAGPIVRAVRGCSKRHIRCVGALIQHNVDLNVKTTRRGKPPLHLAVENDNFNGYEKLIWLLVDNGAKVNKKSGDGETALTILFSKANERALEKHHLQALAILLNAGADTNCALPSTGDLPLHMAVRNKDGWATTMLLHKGADVTARDGSGTTPIQVTANQFRGRLSREHATVLNIILKYVADKDKKAIDQQAGVQGRTALHLAVIWGTVQAVELLLAYGASVLATDAHGHDALYHTRVAAKKLPAGSGLVADHAEIMERLTEADSR